MKKRYVIIFLILSCFMGIFALRTYVAWKTRFINIGNENIPSFFVVAGIQTNNNQQLFRLYEYSSVLQAETDSDFTELFGPTLMSCSNSSIIFNSSISRKLYKLEGMSGDNMVPHFDNVYLSIKLTNSTTGRKIFLLHLDNDDYQYKYIYEADVHKVYPLKYCEVSPRALNGSGKVFFFTFIMSWCFLMFLRKSKRSRRIRCLKNNISISSSE